MKAQGGPGTERAIDVVVGKRTLAGDLGIPPSARGLVLFAHGSGSSRRSPRNRQVAGALREAGLATLLFDLLTTEEEATDELTAEFRFDISLASERIVAVTRFVRSRPELESLPLGYYGASTGAAAAALAAARLPREVRALVCRGGRPDLVSGALGNVHAPTLLIVGSNDYPLIAMNRDALARLELGSRLVLVPGASHLFEEPGALEEVSQLARDWFLEHLAAEQYGISV